MSTKYAHLWLLCRALDRQLLINTKPVRGACVHETDAEYKSDDDDEHETQQREVEDTAIRLHPATIHWSTEHPQHPVVDVNCYSDE